MTKKDRSPEEKERRAKIRELLQASNVSSMDDIQNLFKETKWSGRGIGRRAGLQQVRLSK